MQTEMQFEGSTSKHTRKAKKQACGTVLQNIHASIPVEKRFTTVSIDPPWSYYDKGVRGSAEKHYKTLTVEAIAALPIPDLVQPKGAHLYLWATEAFYFQARLLIEFWGFRHKSTVIWNKEGNLGMGRTFRLGHEYLLFAVKGKQPFRNHSQSSVVSAQRTGRHSEKPAIFRTIIEKCSSPLFLELFARKRVPGWTVWGDDIEL